MDIKFGASIFLMKMLHIAIVVMFYTKLKKVLVVLLRNGVLNGNAHEGGDGER